MKTRLFDLCVASIFGGIIGATVVLCMNGETRRELHAAPAETPEFVKIDTLQVRDLKITGRAVLVDEEKETVVIKDGSVLVDKNVHGKKFVGTQYQGHVFVANRMFTSPDDLVATPMERWHFFTEIGSTVENGGEVIIRSPKGANVVGQVVNTGSFSKIGFDMKDQAQWYTRDNVEGNTLTVPLQAPEIKTGVVFE